MNARLKTGWGVRGIKAIFAHWLMLGLVTSALAREETVLIGSQEVTLPAPQGAVALDEEDTEGVSVRAELVNFSNRLLNGYKAKAMADGSPRVLHAQTPQGIQEVVCSIEQFAEMAHAITAQFLAEQDGTSKSVQTLLEEAQQRPMAGPVAGEIGGLEPGETRGLGVYDRGEHHVSFAVLKRNAEAPFKAHYTAGAMCNVAGKILNLYCRVDAGSEEEARWAREQLAAWRGAVQAANPAPQAEFIEPRPVWTSPLVAGGVASAIAGLFFGVSARKRRQVGPVCSRSEAK